MVSESKATGVTLSYERDAMAGKEMPEGLSYPDQILYQQLRLLYDQHRRGVVDRDTAIREKKELLKSYEIHKAIYDMHEETVKMWKRIELASAAYAKNPSVENADKLYEAIYRVKRKGA